ncbi:MAG TPA: NAD(P)H-binding protein [Streptosporangiaceae bacterium]|nr:NAD(P)H-binding protein [Streptosporangiaceae bacterium]
MKVTIFGATGATGTSLTERALEAGYEVTAVVRDPGRMRVPAHQRLHVVTADVLDPAAISPAVADSGAVLTAIGPPGTGPSTLRQDSTRSIIAAMEKTGARRLMVITGSIVNDDGESPYLRYLLKPVARRTFLRHVYADMLAAEEEIHASTLEWKIFRPPSLNSKPAKGAYRIAIDRTLPHCFRITRDDLATGMLGLLEDPVTDHRHICIAN